MGYRDGSTTTLETPVASGTLKVELGARDVHLSCGPIQLHVVDRVATVLEQRRKKVRRESFKLVGKLLVARDVPHEDLGIWIELPGGVRRVFGVEPVSLLDPGGLEALGALDRVAHRLRAHLADYAGDAHRAFELGRGLDKVLVVDYGERYVIFERRLFRSRARRAMEVHTDGRIVLYNRRKPIEVTVRSRFGLTVTGDYLRFAAPGGRDLARIAIPWISPEDRDELARRIGQLIDRPGDQPAADYPFGLAARAFTAS